MSLFQRMRASRQAAQRERVSEAIGQARPFVDGSYLVECYPQWLPAASAEVSWAMAVACVQEAARKDLRLVRAQMTVWGLNLFFAHPTSAVWSDEEYVEHTTARYVAAHPFDDATKHPEIIKARVRGDLMDEHAAADAINQEAGLAE